MSTEVQQIETVTAPQAKAQGTPNTKVQNKVVNFVEQHTGFSKSRNEFVGLNKSYRELPAEEKPVEVIQLVEKKIKDNKGVEHVVVQEVKRKKFPNEKVE